MKESTAQVLGRLNATIPVKELLPSSVPCNGCTACCRGDIITLHPEMGDDPSQYETREVEIPGRGTVHVIIKNDDGNCVYLGRNGCTIHDRAPAICQEFDCAGLVLKAGNSGVREMLQRGVMSKEVAKRGKELLRRGYRPRKEWRRKQ